MPLNFAFPPSGGRKRTASESNPYRHMLDMNNAYVQMPYFNSPRFVPLPLSPAPAGYGQAGLTPGYNPYAWAWPSPHMSPHMYAADLQPPAPQGDPRTASIHVLLAPSQMMMHQPHILYDIRYKADKCYMSAHPEAVKMPDEFMDQPATNPPMVKMRLVCRDIPWRINVSNAKGATLRDIIEAIYAEMNTPLTEGEWWIAQDEERERVLKTYQENCSDEVPEGMKRKLEDGVKRADWLGKKTMLMSISRSPHDEEFIKARIPDKKAQLETWLIELGEA